MKKLFKFPQNDSTLRRQASQTFFLLQFPLLICQRSAGPASCLPFPWTVCAADPDE